MPSPFGHSYETKPDFVAMIIPATVSNSEFVPITGHADTYLSRFLAYCPCLVMLRSTRCGPFVAQSHREAFPRDQASIRVAAMKEVVITSSLYQDSMEKCISLIMHELKARLCSYFGLPNQVRHVKWLFFLTIPMSYVYNQCIEIANNVQQAFEDHFVNKLWCCKCVHCAATFTTLLALSLDIEGIDNLDTVWFRHNYDLYFFTWAGNSSSPIFLLPRMVMAVFVPMLRIVVLSTEPQREMIQCPYQHLSHDGEWGLHIARYNTMLGSILHYVTLRWFRQRINDGTCAMEKGP
ncbi:hypothetical protein K7X08_025951 [Anisodus acutangulus]|uniref:Uncharacterized protein n=1 Tax=Anisodus acutangulus TaxID=402998 RepID=A0A9Q1RVD0_9SOLA|nr:hypothetical protein K7X08_025951 [Anisodus acutangulus]